MLGRGEVPTLHDPAAGVRRQFRNVHLVEPVLSDRISATVISSIRGSGSGAQPALPIAFIRFSRIPSMNHTARARSRHIKRFGRLF
jgi:hypothetical protein